MVLAVALASAALWRAARPALALAVLAAFAGQGASSLAVRNAEPVVDAIGSRTEVLAVAQTDAAPGGPGPTEGLWRVELAVTSVGGTPAHARVVVWGGDDWSVTARGERLVAEGKLSGADGGASALMWRPMVTSRAAPHGLDAVVAGLRKGLREATASLPERLRPLTRGMVIGDDSGMSAEQRAELSSTGLTHLTAVSGSHFAIVLVAVAALLRLVVRSRRLVAIAIAGAMALLICLVFPEPSVVRAGTMAGAICAALWWGRPAQALPALCAGVLVVAVLDPRLACEPGFAMSVAAVAGIAVWAPALATRLGRHVPAVVAGPLSVCLTAQAAVLPLLALIGAGVSPWAVAANLAVGWCAAPVTLIGLAAVIVGPVAPGLAHALATAAGWCAWPVDAAARLGATLPGAALKVPPGAWGALASGLVLGAMVALTFAVRLRFGSTVVVAALALAALALPVAPRLFAPSAPGNWLIVACDVGQGDAMLLRSGTDSAVVVDVGPAGGAGPDCLRRYGVARIDLLVITHPHADHEGALSEVLDQTPVAKAWISPAEDDRPTAATRALIAANVPVTVVHTGSAAQVGEVTVSVLAPTGRAVGEGSTGLNDASVVTMASVSGVTVLGLGDLEHEGQRELAQRLAPIVVDVVKVPHHGSDRQEQVLAARVSARVAIVSVGADNSYGHPAPDALDMWGQRATVLLRTDQCRDVVVTAGPALATSCPSGMAG